MNTKTKVFIGLAIVGISFTAGIFAKPSKVITQTKEVVKTVTVKEEAKTKVVYKYRIIHPDGTIEETETSKEDTHTVVVDKKDVTKESKNEVIRDSGLTLSALAIVDVSSISGHRDYGLHVTKRVLGNVNVGILATTDKKIGLSIGLSF